MMKKLNHPNRCAVCNKEIREYYECSDEKCKFCKTLLVCSEKCHNTKYKLTL